MEAPKQDHAVLGPLNSEDEARAWVLELVDECEHARFAADHAVMVRDQRKQFCRWLVLRGQAQGVISALKRCGRISDVCHNELRQRVRATEKPTVIPVTMPVGPGRRLW